MSKSVSNQDVKIGSVKSFQIRKESHEILYKQGLGPGVRKGKHPLPCAKHPSWHPLTLIWINVNPRRVQSIVELPVTGPSLVEKH